MESRPASRRKGIEESLAATQTALAEAQAIAQLGSWELNRINNRLTWSDETFRIFGVDPATFVPSYDVVFERIHPEDRAAVEKAYADSVANHEVYDVEHRILMDDGTVKFVHERGKTFYDAEGRPLRSVGTVLDVTKRRATEHALEQSERKYRHLVESSCDIIWEIDADALITFANPAARTVVGYTPEEVVGRSLFAVVHPDEAEKIKMLMATGQPFAQLETTLLRKDGSTVVVQTSATPVFDGDRLVGYHGILGDISARRRAETQLANALALSRAATWEYDVQTNLFTFNDNFYRIYGTTAEKVGGYTMSPDEYARRFVDPEDIPVVAREIQRAIQTHDPHYTREIEHRFVNANGEMGFIAVRILIVKDASGRTIKTYGVNQDVTKLRQTERELTVSKLLGATAIEASLDGILIVDAHQKVISYNQAYAHMWGIGPAKLVFADDRPVMQAKMDQVKDPASFAARVQYLYDHPGETAHEEVEFKDGRVFERDTVCLYDTNRQYLARAWFYRDITERKTAERALRISEENFRTVFGSVREGIFIVAPETGRIVEVNPSGCSMFGYKRDEMIGRDIGMFSSGEAPHTLSTFLRQNRDKQNEQGADIDWHCKTRDGQLFWAAVSVQRVTFRGRNFLLATLRDITERKLAIETARSTLERTRLQLSAIGDLSKAEFLLSGDVDRLAREVTERGARVMGCERVNAWLFNDQETELRCIDLYEASNGVHSSGMVLRESEFRSEFQSLKANTIVAADDPLTDPRTTGYAETYLKPLRITSMLDAVIRIGERNLGLVCFEHVDKPHHWRQDEIAFASQLADKIAIGFVNRQRRIEEDRRRVSEEALAEAQKIAHLGSWSYDPQSNIVTYSKEAFRILNVDPERFEPSFEAYLSRVHPDDRALLEHSRDESVMHHTGFTVDYRLVMDDGSIKWVQDTAHNSYDAAGRHTRQTGTIQDITARKKAEETIARLARFDGLTGLANRSVFVEKLQQAIAWARRSAQSFAVLYLDLDHFKDVNDTLGHPIGDLLLQAVGRRLRASVRETDTVARFGGDEFAIILADIHEPEDAALLADKILKSIADPFSIQGNIVRSGASIGIDVYGTDSFDAESLLSHADVALYRAKSEGRGTYRFFTDAMDAEVRTRVTMGAELHEAIAKKQFFLLYQPQVDIKSGRIVGFEALVRWCHPKRGVVGPSEFIPFAEKSGLIVALGQWVMREACFQIKQWLDAGIAPPLVAVNLSGLEFKTKFELENNIAAVLAETGVPPGSLELELTESVLMDASRQHNDVLIRLRQLGVRIAIDDFGTGYSSLDYLRRFPVDRIKIAQVFVTDLGAPENTAIVKAALGLAHALSIEVIVEGVETVAQLELLKGWGCRYVQGYYFAKPLPVPEATELLRIGSVLH